MEDRGRARAETGRRATENNEQCWRGPDESREGQKNAAESQWPPLSWSSLAPGDAPRTHLLQLQLNDLLLEGVGFVLSLHVGFFYAVLLGTEIQGRQVSSFKTATRLLSLVTATTPSQQTLIFVFPVSVCVCTCMRVCVHMCGVCGGQKLISSIFIRLHGIF